MPPGDLLVSLRGVTKDYHGLRPLRIERLELREGESIAMTGLDRAGAEVLVDLITAASLPDSGDVDIFGKPTRSITGSDTWLRELDHFGIVSERAVLLEQLTVEQNLALPMTLELDELQPAVRARVRELAVEVGIATDELPHALARLDATGRLRVRLGRALAINPRVLLAEHPNATLPPSDAPTFAADFLRIIERRHLAALVLTADRTFAGAVAERVLTLQPATGELKSSAGWRRWFR
jgi:D-xylose transport system ATP-binding protein